MKYILYVGSWKNKQGEGGIHVFTFDMEKSKVFSETVFHPQIAAGYMCFSHDRKSLYVCDEVRAQLEQDEMGGAIYQYKIEKGKTKLIFQNKVITCGAHPNGVAEVGNGQYLAVSNYGSEIDNYSLRVKRNEDGSFNAEKIYDDASTALINIDTNGVIEKVSDLFLHKDNPSCGFPIFQSSPHPHSIGVDRTGKIIACADRGCDEILFFSVEESCGKLLNKATYHCRTMYGPRQVIFHTRRNWIYVVNEILPYITLLEYNDDATKIEEIANYSTAEERSINNFEEFMNASHPSSGTISADGNYLYVPNRGENTIVKYSIDSDTGMIECVNRFSSAGVQPWACALSEDQKLLAVVNQFSNNLAIFDVSDTNTLIADIKVSKPVSVVFS